MNRNLSLPLSSDDTLEIRTKINGVIVRTSYSSRKDLSKNFEKEFDRAGGLWTPDANISLSILDKSKVAFLYSEYLSDPNCRPIDWIAGEDLSDDEKDLFLTLVRNREELERYLDELERKHP